LNPNPTALKEIIEEEQNSPENNTGVRAHTAMMSQRRSRSILTGHHLSAAEMPDNGLDVYSSS